MNQRKWKRVLALFLTRILMVCGNGVLTAYGEENKEADGVQEDILIQAPAGILIEADTGTVLYKKSEEEKGRQQRRGQRHSKGRAGDERSGI